MDERWNIGEPGGPAGPFYSIVSSTGRVIVLQIPDRETAERICKLPELEARAAELETQLAPLQQQFDDWAEQNRRAEAESHRRREELEIAIHRMIRKEQWARAWKRAAKTRRAWMLRYKERLGKAAEEDERLRAALLASLAVIRHVPHGQTLTDGEFVELQTAKRLAREALEGAT